MGGHEGVRVQRRTGAVRRDLRGPDLWRKLWGILVRSSWKIKGCLAGGWEIGVPRGIGDSSGEGGPGGTKGGAERLGEEGQP